MTRARRGTKARKWEDDFLAAFSVHANVSAACQVQVVGMTSALERAVRNSGPDAVLEARPE